MTTRAIDALASLERQAHSAYEVLERSGVANLVVLVRVRMGFPPETFALAAQPLLAQRLLDLALAHDAARGPPRGPRPGLRRA